MITIKMHAGKWRLEITEEKWEFDDIKEMLDCVGHLVGFKNAYGRIER